MKERLELFNYIEGKGDGNSVAVSDDEFLLVENAREGLTSLTVKLNNKSILFPHADSSKISWYKNRKCADNIVLSFSESGVHVHIFEIKRTVTSTTWEDIKKQFSGAMIYAAGLMGVFGEKYDVQNVSVHTAYLHDRLTYVPEDPIV